MTARVQSGRPWPSACLGRPRGREQSREWFQRPGCTGAGGGGRSPYPKKSCSKYEPLPPFPLGNPRSPHLLRHGWVPTRDQQSRPACNEFRGTGSPLPTGDPGSLAQPDRARVGTCESLLGPPGGSQGVSPKWSRRRGRRPGRGEFCPRGSMSSGARSTLRYSRHPARRQRGACALGCAPFVAPAALECPRRFRESAGSFRGCNSIVIERIHRVWFWLR